MMIGLLTLTSLNTRKEKKNEDNTNILTGYQHTCNGSPEREESERGSEYLNIGQKILKFFEKHEFIYTFMALNRFQLE